MSIHAIIAEARRLGDPAPLIAAIPYARMLGLRAAEGVRAAGDPGDLVLRMPFRDDLVGNPVLPALHGGAVGAFLELTAELALLWRMEGEALPRGVTLSVDYLRPARALDCFARGEITRLGRRVANVRVTAWQDDPSRPFAQGNLHMLVTPQVEGRGPADR